MGVNPVPYVVREIQVHLILYVIWSVRRTPLKRLSFNTQTYLKFKINNDNFWHVDKLQQPSHINLL